MPLCYITDYKTYARGLKYRIAYGNWQRDRYALPARAFGLLTIKPSIAFINADAYSEAARKLRAEFNYRWPTELSALNEINRRAQHQMRVFIEMLEASLTRSLANRRVARRDRKDGPVLGAMRLA